MTHTCTQAGCDEQATHCVIEPHPLAMMFDSGAGLLCQEHADHYGHLGGIVLGIGKPRECNGGVWVQVANA